MTLLQWALGSLSWGTPRETAGRPKKELTTRRLQDMLPKGAYNITSDDLLMRTLRRGWTKKSVSTWQKGLANVIAASIPNYLKTALHGLDSPRVAAVRASRRQRDYRDTAFNCDSEEKFAMFLSHSLPEGLTEELRQQMLTDGIWDSAVIKMDRLYGSTLGIQGVDGC